MQSINILSLLAFVVVAFLGAIAHWGKKKRRGEVQGKLIDYLVADSPGSTTMMAVAILVAAITAAMTGALDGLDLHVAWAYLKVWNIPMPTAHVLVSAFTLGWMADSGLNKGAKS